MHEANFLISEAFYNIPTVLPFLIIIIRPVFSAEYQCKSVGKFVDPKDSSRYHQCFYLFGELTYIHNNCPSETCFDPVLDYCYYEACKKKPVLPSTTTTRRPPISDKPGFAYNCKNKSYQCTTSGVFANEKDSSVYFKCFKIWGKWKFTCYTCNSKHKTCFSNQLQMCVPNDGKPCNQTRPGLGGEETSGRGEGSGHVTPIYECEGYNFFPCHKLGVGLHGFPGDPSVYMKCSKTSTGEMKGECLACPKRGRTCFMERLNQCVENCGEGSNHQPYNCSTFTEEDVGCEKDGLIAYPKDPSVFFNCFKAGDKWYMQCFTCSNGQTKTCFSNSQQACVTVGEHSSDEDHKCPSTSLIDGPHSQVGRPDESVTWDCSGYNELSFPCKDFEEGVYEIPADRTVYFQCIQKGPKMVAICQHCSKKTWSCYDPDKEACVKDCIPRTNVPYDCSTYHEHSYPCKTTGIFANPNDTSVYHQCMSASGGKYKAICYACSNGKIQTCFDDEQKACVTTGSRQKTSCGTIEEFSGNPDKGSKEDSMTYSKDGYTGSSASCTELGPGEWENPGDKSVYISCGSIGETEFQVCPKESQSCYVKEEKRCIENCGMGPPTTTRPPTTTTRTTQTPPTTSTIIPPITSTMTPPPTTTTISPPTTTKIPSLTTTKIPKDTEPHLSYKCDGFDKDSFDCEALGEGNFPIPGDKSIYVQCRPRYVLIGELVAKCHACSPIGKECFDEKTQTCVINCGKEVHHKPYDCSTYYEKSYPCRKAGIFANKDDTSIYFECVRSSGVWKSYCFTCNSDKKTCYSEKKEACVTNNGKPCGSSSGPEPGGNKDDSLSHSCKGYSDKSFPCKSKRQGTYAFPGDPSVYVTCGAIGEYQKCEACPAKTKSCYDNEKSKCVPNCGVQGISTTTSRPTLKPVPSYDCTGKSFTCEKAGVFAYKTDTSIYFNCVIDIDDPNLSIVSVCFTCNSKDKTCYSEAKKSCVNTNGVPCGDASKIPVDAEPQFTYDCDGYSQDPLICEKFPAELLPVPGDKSIYIHCNLNKGIGECRACEKIKDNCYDGRAQGCKVGGSNCGKSRTTTTTMRPTTLRTTKPAVSAMKHDCSLYKLNSFPCQKEGLFANPSDPSVFFKCVKTETGKWESWCYACNPETKSCFKENKKRCVVGCKDDSPNTYGSNCRDYKPNAIPCTELATKSSLEHLYWEHPGDPSVYFTCDETETSHQALCHRCPISTCFNEKLQDCTFPCKEFVPPDKHDYKKRPRQYDCSLYRDDSYPCSEDGVHMNPFDMSLYFQCVQIAGEWISVCFTCHRVFKTCFEEFDAMCVYSDSETCGTFSDPHVYENNGGSHDCSGYPPESLPCKQLGEGIHFFPGDPGVYFTCHLGEHGLYGECHTCPKTVYNCSEIIDKVGITTPTRRPTTTLMTNKAPVASKIVASEMKYDCSLYKLNIFPCQKEGLFSNPSDPSVFFKCVKNKAGKWESWCYSCNKETNSCFMESKKRCVIGCKEGSTNTYGTNCKSYGPLALPCTSLISASSRPITYLEHPGDPAVYFTCMKSGIGYRALCHRCPISTCFDEKLQECTFPCKEFEPPTTGPRDKFDWKYHPSQYDCLLYRDDSWPCYEEGVHVNPFDTSMYFRCIKVGGEWFSLCYTCHRYKKTCYDQTEGLCVKGDWGECEKASAEEPWHSKEGTYDCTGYPPESLPCTHLGPGRHYLPGDASVHYTCKSGPEGLVGECHECPKSVKNCSELFGNGITTATTTTTTTITTTTIRRPTTLVTTTRPTTTVPTTTTTRPVRTTTVGPLPLYDCVGVSFKCEKEGVFAYKSDTSLYFVCVKKQGLQAICFTCNSNEKTCYSEEKNSCVKTNGKPCEDPSKIPEDAKPHLSYTCDGYSEGSIECAKLGEGFHAVPGDKSVFIECTSNKGKLAGKCHACSKVGDNCYDEKSKVCVKNCGKGETHLPYDCSTYDDKSYPCTKIGIFANKLDTSIYFQCVKMDSVWKSYCYTCSSEKKTCYSEQKEACVKNNGKSCGNSSAPEPGGSKNDSLTYSCKGYNDKSFPCSKRGAGTYVMPGDPSVYITCGANGEYSKCEACEAETKSCFMEKDKRCVENCGKGLPPNPYNCSGNNQPFFKCPAEGIFANPKDSSIYFQCKRDTSQAEGWKINCLTCNRLGMSCFDDLSKACVDNERRECVGKTMEIVNKLANGTKQWLPRDPLRMYTCAGYDGFKFNCPGAGNFTLPGDPSVYYTCTQKGSDPTCNFCPRQTKSCFIEKSNECVENCGIGPIVTVPTKPYDCSIYNLKSFPCQKEGLFANPQDPTIFFKCVKNKAGSWESWCYSCNFQTKSCFKESKKRCIIGCKDDSTNSYGTNCKNYGPWAIPCTSLASVTPRSPTYLEHPGDAAVYFTCMKSGTGYRALCHRCPISTCFDEKLQECTFPCKEFVPPTTGPRDMFDWKYHPSQYDCLLYRDDSWPCYEEGLHVNPFDTSMYFQCIRVGGEWFSLCYTCHRYKKYCFDEREGLCVKGEWGECDKASVPNPEPWYSKEGTYDCTGYPPESLPCAHLGPGPNFLPGDSSVYFTCKQDGANRVGQCFECPQTSNSCQEIANLKPIQKSYSCETYNEKSFQCMRVGFFAHPNDSSIFFQCIKDSRTKAFKPLCYTCNNNLKTCFSNKRQVCLTKADQSCGASDPADNIGSPEDTGRQYTCEGYNDQSFPCSYYESGLFSTPADPSIYFSCEQSGDKWIAQCKSCSEVDKACFDEEQKICVENCGKGPVQPYSCDAYGEDAIPCTQEGFFQNFKDRSVFFQCSKGKGATGLKAHCFTCNKKMATCFNEGVGSCLFNKGQSCIGKLADGPKDKTDIEKSMTYDCDGYNEKSIPCNMKGVGKHVHPADRSVYFECVAKNGKLVAECRTCDASRRECFVDKEQKCVENCGLGPHKLWNCETRRFSCNSNGIFVDTIGISVFHKCVRKLGRMQSQCFSCSGGIHKTCFSMKKQTCLRVNGNLCPKTDPADEDPEITADESMTYDCTGYNKVSFPCEKYRIPGTYATPADKSVYFECKNTIVNGLSTAVAECKVCNAETQSVYDPVEKRCVVNLGKGPHQPYNCQTYNDRSFKCKEEGFFANPKDNSVFFKCVRVGTKWESYCYSCSSSLKTCFSNSLQACVTTGGRKCEGGDPVPENKEAGNKENSMTYDCSGYNEVSIPCAKFNPGVYGNPGDASVFFKCETQNDRYIAVCDTCDKATSSCFDRTKGVKKCVPNCGKGPQLYWTTGKPRPSDPSGPPGPYWTMRPRPTTTPLPPTPTTDVPPSPPGPYWTRKPGPSTTSLPPTPPYWTTRKQNPLTRAPPPPQQKWMQVRII